MTSFLLSASKFQQNDPKIQQNKNNSSPSARVRMCVCVCLCVCVGACVRAWVRGWVGAWVRGCVGAWVCVCVFFFSNTPFYVCKRFVPASIAQWLWFHFGILWLLLPRHSMEKQIEKVGFHGFFGEKAKGRLALPVVGPSIWFACSVHGLGRHVGSCDILQWLAQVISVQPNAVCSDHPYHCGVAQHP